MRIYFFILLCIIAFSACSFDRKPFVGVYQSYADSNKSDGVDIDVNINTTTEFGWFDVCCKSNVTLLFSFDEKLNFPNIILDYKTQVEGNWDIDDSIITIELDTTSLKYEFVKSNATCPTERAMVRNLRQFVRDTYLPDIKRKIIKMSSINIEVQQLSDSLLIIERCDDGRDFAMRKISD